MQQDPLQRLGEAFDQIVVSDEDCPVKLSVLLPSNSHAIGLDVFPTPVLPGAGRIANGRGFSEHECLVRGWGEAAELLSCCHWGDEALVHCTADELNGPCLTPDVLLGLTAAQLKERGEWNAQSGDLDWRVCAWSQGTAIDWMPVERSDTGQVFHAPADFMLIGRREAGDEEAVAIADSNGCACGRDLTSAKLSAVLELVERDAIARWWYGQRTRPAIDHDTMLRGTGLTEWFSTKGRVVSFVNVSSDVHLPVVVAISSEQDGTDIAIASAGAMDWKTAVRSAASELVQMEFSLNIARQTPGVSRLWDQWLSEVTMKTPPFDRIGEVAAIEHEPAPSNSDQQLQTCLAACAEAGVSIYFRDMTRPEVGIPAVRAISPELCVYKPRFARGRLLQPDEHDIEAGQSPSVHPNPMHLLV